MKFDTVLRLARVKGGIKLVLYDLDGKFSNQKIPSKLFNVFHWIITATQLTSNSQRKIAIISREMGIQEELVSPVFYNEAMPDSWNFASAFFNCMPPTFSHSTVASNPISYHSWPLERVIHRGELLQEMLVRTTLTKRDPRINLWGIEVADVLKWCIATTCTHTRKSIPLWATRVCDIKIAVSLMQGQLHLCR